MTEIRVVLVTVPDEETGLSIARTLIQERLAACVNLVPGLRSLYLWQGKVEDDQELLLIIKTRQDLLESLTARVQALHPYDVAEVVALAVEGGSQAYLDWVAAETGPKG